MKLIERVSIHRFRSIGEVEFETDSLNIFSGTNNSGKSNALRALNLFFNSEAGFQNPFNFENDYNKAYTGWYGGKREIRIVLHFAAQGNAALSSPFRISRTFGIGTGSQPQYEFQSDDPEVQAKINKREGNVLRQFNTFMGRIEYLYVPAVRDKVFVRDLLLRFEQLLNVDPGNDFKGKLDELSGILADKSIDISRDFEQFIHLETEAVLSTNITDILGAIRVMVDSGIEITERVAGEGRKSKVKVDLFSTGDGILMSYLAYFLAHVSKSLTNKYFIWGFEEPENSIEYSKAQRLANDFTEEFTQTAQIFLTTHSPAFIKLRERPNTAFYRVFIEQGNTKRLTQIVGLRELKERQRQLFDTADFGEQYKQLTGEIGLLEQAAEIEMLVSDITHQQMELKEQQSEYISANAALLALHPTKIFLCEDDSRQTKALWQHLLVLVGLSDVEVWSSQGSSNENAEIGLKEHQKNDRTYKPRVFRQVDRDGLSLACLDAIERKYNAKYSRSFPYKYLPLPVNEIENFAILADTSFTENLWLDNQEDLRDAFERTLSSLFDRFTRIFRGTDDSYLFPDGSTRTQTIQNMRREAQRDWRRYMPGKEVIKLIDNYNFSRSLQELSYERLPHELRNYLNEVKAFFEA